MRLAGADTVVYLDFPAWLCVWRVLKRISFSLGRVRPDMADDCPEHFNLEFLLYTATFPFSRKKRTAAKLAAFGGTVIPLRNPAEVRRFLASFDR
jgi:adenylate kinase family enzyme